MIRSIGYLIYILYIKIDYTMLLLLLLLMMMMMTHIFNVNTYQQQFSPHKRNTQTLYIPLLLFLYDMFQ